MLTRTSDKPDETRTLQRAPAHAQRDEPEDLHRARTAGRRRATLGGLVGVVVVAVVIVLAGSVGATSKMDTAETVAGVTSLLRGIPQERERLGRRDAPVTLQIFGDLECPACRYLTVHILPTLIKEFVRTGELKLEYHSFQSYTPEQAVFEEQQVAALAAGQQNKMWYYVELFYHEPGSESSNYVTESYLDGLARQVPGLNFAKWMAARSEPDVAGRISTDGLIGTRYGWESTPDFLLGNGAALHPYNPPGSRPRVFVKAIKERLAHHSRRGRGP